MRWIRRGGHELKAWPKTVFRGTPLLAAFLTYVAEACVGVAGFLALDPATDPRTGSEGTIGLLACCLPLIALPLLGLLAISGAVLHALPVLALSAWAAGRQGRTWWLWCIPIAAGTGTLYTLVVASPLQDHVLWWVCISAGALLAAWNAGFHLRQESRTGVMTARGRIGFRTFMAGSLSVALLLAGSAVAYSIGLVTRYEPPVLSVTAVVGTWTDGNGGTAVLTADGGAVLTGIVVDDGFGDFPGELATTICAGRGTWAYQADPDVWKQRVVINGPGCGDLQSFEVGGRTGRPQLFFFVGDPDSPVRYGLTRQSG